MSGPTRSAPSRSLSPHLFESSAQRVSAWLWMEVDAGEDEHDEDGGSDPVDERQHGGRWPHSQYVQQVLLRHGRGPQLVAISADRVGLPAAAKPDLVAAAA